MSAKRERSKGGAPDPTDIRGALLAGALVLTLTGILLWRDPWLFWNDDYELSILPVFADIARSWSEGHLPLLSPYSWVCSNLAGEFQYGTFSVFVNAAVIAIWTLPLTFPQQAAALSMVHLFFFAVGGYLLARERRLSAPLATMVALVTAANGWVICWGATDWFGALGALTWFPWAWWGLERALDPARGRWRFVWPALFVYLLITGGFPYTVVMVALLTAWLAIKSVTETRSWRALVPATFGSLLGVGMSSPAWLALFDYVRGSARQTQDASAHWQWLLPPASLPGFILPAWTVNWSDFSTRLMPHAATELACGLVAPAALIAGLVASRGLVAKKIRWQLALLAVVLVISMLPSANVFRWSFRWLPFIHLALALCGAEALQYFATQQCEQRDSLRRALVSPGAAAIALVFLTASAMYLQGGAWNAHWPVAVWTLGLAAFWASSERFSLRSRALHSWTPAAITFGVLLATYLLMPTNVGVPKYNLDQNLTEASPLDPQRLYLSVYPEPERVYRMGAVEGPIGQTVRPGSTSMWAGVRFINGYSPVRPAGVAREFDAAIHGELAPWSGEYFLGWEAAADGKLAELGVDGIIVANEIHLTPKPDAEWELAHTSGEGRVYHRRGGVLPRVQVLLTDRTRPNEQFAPAAVKLINDSRNEVTLDVDVTAGGSPALLTFSRPFFRGYRASIEGRDLPVRAYRGLMPAIEVPAATRGRLVLTYQPWWLVAGGAVALVCAAIWGIGVVAATNQRR